MKNSHVHQSKQQGHDGYFLRRKYTTPESRRSDLTDHDVEQRKKNGQKEEVKTMAKKMDGEIKETNKHWRTNNNNKKKDA